MLCYAMLESVVRGLHTSNDYFANCLPRSFGLPPADCWSFVVWLQVCFRVVAGCHFAFCFHEAAPQQLLSDSMIVLAKLTLATKTQTHCDSAA